MRERPGPRACLILVIAAVSLSACAKNRVPKENARDAIQTQYTHLADAIKSGHVEEILSFQAPNFTANNANGKISDYAAMEQYTRTLTAAVDSVIHVQNVIRTFTQHGDTAIVDVCQEFSRIQRIDDQPHRVDTSVLQRETWVRLESGWKRLHVDNEHGQRWFIDGVRIDPSNPRLSAPPYVPAVDESTGCGLL